MWTVLWLYIKVWQRNSQPAGEDPDEDHDRHGSEPLKPIYGQQMSLFTWRGTECRRTDCTDWNTQVCEYS